MPFPRAMRTCSRAISRASVVPQAPVPMTAIVAMASPPRLLADGAALRHRSYAIIRGAQRAEAQRHRRDGTPHMLQSEPAGPQVPSVAVVVISARLRGIVPGGKAS